MEILTEITKEVFESNVPAAKMPERNDSVYLRLQKEFEVAYNRICTTVISRTMVDHVEADDAMKAVIIRLVCQTAFIHTIRSLDLVLTATGFGIVSTNSTAPASKNRVDALLADMRKQACETMSLLLAGLILTEGWGSTMAARQNIQTLFYDYEMLERYTTLEPSADSWQKARGLAFAADAMLRKAISPEYMEELLVKVRSFAVLEADQSVIDECLVFTGNFISNYDTNKNADKMMLDSIVDIMELDIDSYPTYQASNVYKARHMEQYTNRKDDPTFFFM